MVEGFETLYNMITDVEVYPTTVIPLLSVPELTAPILQMLVTFNDRRSSSSSSSRDTILASLHNYAELARIIRVANYLGATLFITAALDRLYELLFTQPTSHLKAIAETTTTTKTKKRKHCSGDKEEDCYTRLQYRHELYIHRILCSLLPTDLVRPIHACVRQRITPVVSNGERLTVIQKQQQQDVDAVFIRERIEPVFTPPQSSNKNTIQEAICAAIRAKPNLEVCIGKTFVTILDPESGHFSYYYYSTSPDHYYCYHHHQCQRHDQYSIGESIDERGGGEELHFTHDTTIAVWALKQKMIVLTRIGLFCVFFPSKVVVRVDTTPEIAAWNVLDVHSDSMRLFLTMRDGSIRFAWAAPETGNKVMYTKSRIDSYNASPITRALGTDNNVYLQSRDNRLIKFGSQIKEILYSGTALSIDVKMKFAVSRGLRVVFVSETNQLYLLGPDLGAKTIYECSDTSQFRPLTEYQTRGEILGIALPEYRGFDIKHLISSSTLSSSSSSSATTISDFTKYTALVVVTTENHYVFAQHPEASALYCTINNNHRNNDDDAHEKINKRQRLSTLPSASQAK